MKVSFNKNDSDVAFDVDLDGVNNYQNVPVPGNNTNLSLPELYAACVLKTSDAKMSAKEFTENYGNFEQKDANWHTVKNEQSEFVGRFAVMAKDQASLINLQSSLGTQGLDDIASQAKTVDRSELSTLLTNNTTDLMNINTVLGSSSLTKPTYTTASTNSSRTLNLNMVDGKDFFLYLNEDQSLYTDHSENFLLKFQKTNGKIAANFDDYTDIDSIPNVLSMFNWTEEEIESLDPYGLKSENSAILPTDIFMGQEGIRISEVMVMPEQSYTFSGETKSYAALSLISSENRSETGYFYKPSGAKLTENAYIAEQQRSDVEVQKIELSSTEDLSEGLAVKCGAPIEIRNPGGPYQVWVKMKVTAKATSSDTTSGAGQLYEKIKNSFYDNADISKADIVVNKWISNSDGSVNDIRSSTVISKLSPQFCAKFSTEEKTLDADSWKGKSLKELFAYCPGLETDNTVVIVADNKTPPEWVLNPKMNLGADKKDVAVQYGNATTKPLNERVNDIKENAPIEANGQYSVAYPFGTRVIEVAMYDEGAGTDEAGQPKDELIGMFYCINTNGFAEDDAHLAKNKGVKPGNDGTWKDEDDDYLWFYSVGVPAWMKYNELPSWLQVRTKESDVNPPLQASETTQEYFNNLCVFPRKECKLKFMFRLVDMADARFNMSEKASDENKPNYEVGVKSLKIGGTTYTSETDISGFGREHAIVGRPQWLKGDQVDVEIKEMVVTQQLYSTSLNETFRENASESSKIEEHTAPKTYNYLDSVDPVNLQLYKLPNTSGKLEFNAGVNELIFFRNQRLENRVANESHAGEYVELFNGSSKPVNLDGWVLKVEQYKKMADGSYHLLGPENPYEAMTLDTSESALEFSYTDPKFDYLKSSGGYETGRPDYILLSDTTLASAGEGQSALPYAVIANGRMTAVDNGDTLKFSYTDSVFSPYTFENSSDIALGSSKMLTSQEAPAMEPGTVYLSPSNKLTEETLTSETGDANYFVPVSQNGLSVNNCTLRKNVFQSNDPNATIPSTIPWKSLDNGNIDYETYNLVYGTFKAAGKSSWCNEFEVNSNSMSYHGNQKRFSVSFNLAKDEFAIDPELIKAQLRSVGNPFESLPKKIFGNEAILWNALQEKVNKKNINDADLVKDYLSLMLPVFDGNDIKEIENKDGNHWWTGKSGKWNQKKSNELIGENAWKYNYFNSDNDIKGKIDLMKKVWPSNIEICLTFKINPEGPAYPGYSEDAKGGAAQYSSEETKFYVHFPWASQSSIPDSSDIQIYNNESGLFSLFDIRQGFLNATDSLPGTVINKYATVPVNGTYIPGVTYNFFPNSYGDKIFKDENPADGNDIEDMVWAFVPVRFHVVRELKEIVKENSVAVYDINTANIWNYLSKSDMNLVKTFNIPYTSQGITVSKDSVEFEKDSYIRYHKSTGVNPLHFRDDADRIVLTLMAPKDEKVKISAGTTGKGIYSVESVAGKIFSLPDGNGDLPLASKQSGSYVIKGAAEYSQTYGEGNHISFGLASEMEWLCGYDKKLDRHADDGDTSDSLPSEAYNIADRAVLDKDVINKVYYKRYYDASSGYSASDRKYDSYEKDPTRDWWGNRSVALSTFFTDPLLLRKAVPGTVENTSPFSSTFNFSGRQSGKPGFPAYFLKVNNDSSSYGGKGYSFLNLKENIDLLNPFEEDSSGKNNEITSAEMIAELSARYWEPHIEVFKPGPGPLNKNLNFILTANGSPGQSNYRFNHIEGCTDYGMDDHQNPHVNFRDFISPVNLSDNIQNWAEEIKNIEATYHYKDAENPNLDKTGSYSFYDLQHKGFDRTTHRLTTFNTHDCYIKNAPLSSVSELCSVPAPGIENAGLNDNPLLSNSYTNAFVDGLEGSLQYFTKLQKQKIFSGTSVDGSVLNLGVLSKMVYPSPAPSGTLVGESEDSNPRVIKVSTVFDKTHWGINYLFKCVGDDKVFYPGKYRIYVTGLDKDWNAFKSIIIMPSMSLFNTLDATSKIDPEIVTKAGGTYLDNIDQIKVGETENQKEDLTADKMVQLLPLSGGEYFNVDDSLEITLVSNPDSGSVLSNIASESSSVKDVVNKVTQAMDFKKINIYLIPQDKVGNVNINTAPIETLLRIPGLQDAIDEGVSGLQRTAANEVVKDILAARDVKPFTDAGKLLTYDFLDPEDKNPGNADQKRIFPVTGNDVGVIATIGAGAELEEQRCKFAQLKCNIYERMLPHIQFAGSSFEIISLGQTLNSKTGKVASSAKVSMTVDLRSLLEDLSEKFVFDPWNVGTNKLEQAESVTSSK